MKTLLTAGALALSLITLAITPSAAMEYKAGDITITNPWARATPGQPRNGGAYLMIKGGATDDQLTGAETPVSKKAAIHGHSNENGVMKMREVHGLDVPAGEMVMLKPGGYHVMLMKLKHALKKGGSFPLTLHFAKAGDVTVDVRIMGVGAMNAETKSGHGGHGDHNPHGKMKKH
ncbi:MAG: copper chaperone PCu(A)C [Rhodospirillaceae bacterium]|nr:copper chaperone PCu(A)C [Rhodospirillaceae bacterium]